MQNIEDLPSDSSDDDYDPGKDSNGEDEDVSDVPEDSDTEVTDKNKSGGSKRKRKKLPDAAGLHPPKRRGGICLEDADAGEEKVTDDGTAKSAGTGAVTVDDNLDEEEKNRLKADLLWADFNKDSNVKTTPKQVSAVSNPSLATVSTTLIPSKTVEKPTKVEITRIFDFAGEEVRVKSAVDADSKEARQHADSITSSPALERLQPTSQLNTPSPSQSGSTPSKQIGLSGVLNKLGLKKKISVLDKSKLDWNEFKNKEGIDDEIKTFNKGKDGYIEKQAFLQRADVRQFELEKNLRMAKRSNR